MKMSQSKSYKDVFVELRNITTIDWACKAASFLEKGLWAFIGIIGTIWAVYFISLQFISWDKNASVLIQGNSEETELKYPAITICPKVSTKYGIAERLANYIDPNQLPEKLLPLKKDFFKCALSRKVLSPLDISEKYDDANWIENGQNSGCGKIQSAVCRSRRIKTHYIMTRSCYLKL